MFFQNILKRWAELDEMAQDPMHAYISMLLTSTCSALAFAEIP
jgi:hypothetical protein